MKSKSNKALIGSGIITAIASSLCCITPVLALIAGTGGLASSFSWVEPFRPYLIGITILVLAFAWYQKLKPTVTTEIECACEEDNKSSFWQSKMFLAIVTVFAVVMLAFPYYSTIFYPDNKKEVVIVDAADIQIIHLDIKGMTCLACDSHITHAAQEVDGVIDAVADFKTGKADVRYDKSKTSKESIINSINKTGYKVINKQNN